MPAVGLPDVMNVTGVYHGDAMLRQITESPDNSNLQVKGNRKKFELSGVRVIGSLRQKTGSKEISK